MKRSDFNFSHSAQGILKMAEAPAACGSACGAADRSATEGDACNKQETAEDKPAACGSACGAGDKEEKPAACGSACGAGEK